MYKKLIDFIRGWYQTDKVIPLHEPRFFQSDRDYVLAAIDSTFVSSAGVYVDRFEQNLARCLGTEHAVATVNGTAALHIALKLAGAGAGTEVITQPLTFVATANAIVYNNALPVFTDVDRQTLGMCPLALERFLDRHAEKKSNGTFNRLTGKKIAAVLPMHTFGHPCDMEKILELAGFWDIPVVEDAAEAIGSKIGTKSCGTFGLLGILSFNGNKIVTGGGGGAIIIRDKKLAQKARHLTTTAKVGHNWEFFHDDLGYNYRLPNLNAALACAQLERLEVILEDKRLLAKAYQDFFKNAGWGVFCTEPSDCTSNFWLNCVILPDRDRRDQLLEKTNASGVMTRPAWALMPDLPMYKNCLADEMSNARWLSERIVNLPSSGRKNYHVV